ncbi:hypothetical protein QE152_g38415 [Popillia japonica]|uniref:Uncharacterized protein n=1 Tax=Popillia japonica TaxID=7064 RepID=A0AAW1HWZ4_POPJA
MMVGSSENDELLAHLVVPEEQTRDNAADGGGASAAGLLRQRARRPGRHVTAVIRAFLKREYDDNARIAVRCCHTVSDRRDFLHRATSNDRYILTNLRTDELNMNYRLCCWARRTTTFDYSDLFAVENRDPCRFLRRYLRDFQRQNLTICDATTTDRDFYSLARVLRQLDEGRMQVVEQDRLLSAPWPSSRRRRSRPSQQIPVRVRMDSCG